MTLSLFESFRYLFYLKRKKEAHSEIYLMSGEKKHLKSCWTDPTGHGVVEELLLLFKWTALKKKLLLITQLDE